VSDCEQFDQCQKRFDVIDGKLDRLDDAIRGNGHPGIKIRLDRLEGKDAIRSRVTWLIMGALLALLIALVRSMLMG